LLGMEAQAETVEDQPHPSQPFTGLPLGLAENDKVVAVPHAKYPQYYSGEMAFRPFWVLRPHIIYAWTLAGFPSKATPWTFKQPDARD
ncbi:MAG: hypothetical protein QOF51_1658, partial [Chloroflexota bacterium]|nr:hypothetical protein [Chloroflexota bacterium]